MLKYISLIDFTEYTTDDLESLLFKIKFFVENTSKPLKDSFQKCLAEILKNRTPDEKNHILHTIISDFFDDTWEINIIMGLCLLYNFSHDMTKENFNKLILVVKEYIHTQNDIYYPVYIDFMKVCEDNIDLLNPDILKPIYSQVIREFFSVDSNSVICAIPEFIAKFSQNTTFLETSLRYCQQFLNSSNFRFNCSALKTFSLYLKYPNPPTDNILTLINTMLSNNKDEEIRVSATEQLQYFSNLQNVNIDELRKLFDKLIYDRNYNCRTLIASYLPSFVNLLGMEYVTNGICTLISDESQQVRMAAIQSSKTSNISCETAIIRNLRSNYGWREKQNLVHSLEAFGNVTVLNSIVRLLLLDDAYAVRLEMVNYLPALIKKNGNQWKEDVIFPIIGSIACSDEYEIRQTAIMAIIKIECYDDKGLNIINQAANDKVPNVRLILAKYLPRKFNDIIDKLKNDIDPDVREYALKENNIIL
ncbi:Serine/threonine-protein phosphatase 2A 65 kDa regulatory subunit A alpha isoform [Histomonas meleagridis]|uniref:Serine/threonine-protein phosphatase 2A 65 kDa regulatory subunit A alpha isoform n=1 Tax=Histomonas meleagridis TaxID=135588 RepID=UPI00355A15AD|nr:Serine/threonine-protein phosphatase 2A 65 kDa regulatory subunit A alpha isoform [Histomonas meleagridis]KAH0798337.1 Serine/threonine-protein phosphatase 2A 65 kDa regulatory subunit A alpha isoform [Histomonas meleagridis]